jgi:coenzyme F420-reducing hydrogenase alpha subunit
VPVPAGLAKVIRSVRAQTPIVPTAAVPGGAKTRLSKSSLIWQMSDVDEIV